MAQSEQASGGPTALRVVWHKFYTLNSQEWIVGEVKNESAVPLNRVHIVGEFFSEDGRTIEWADAPLDAPILLPGHTSHFRVLAPYTPEIEKSLFHFQTDGAEQIGFRR